MTHSHRYSIRGAVVAALVTMVCFAPHKLTAQNGTWVVYDTRTSDIGGNNVSAVAPDGRGVWVGTYTGLSRLKGAEWMDYSMFNEKLKDQSINCLMVDSRGVLWIGTDDYGVIEFDGTHWTEYNSETRRLKMKFVKEIVQDRDGVYWIGVTLGGIVRYDGYTWDKFTPDDCDLLSDFVLDLAVDRANRKWITTNAGVSVFNDRQWVSYTVQNSGLPDDIVPAVAIDKNNVKWFGTLGGLTSFDGEEWRTWNTANSPLPSNQINDIAIDQDGLLWLGTNGGVAVFDGVDRWEVFTQKNSQLPAGNIYKVATDAKGNRWFGNDSRGLACLTGYKMPDKAADETAQASTQPQYSRPEATTVSDERIRINPYLDEGYVTISTESAQADVMFVNAAGKVVKRVDGYKNGQRIAINKMPKGMYTVRVKTERGERKIKFNLK